MKGGVGAQADAAPLSARAGVALEQFREKVSAVRRRFGRVERRDPVALQGGEYFLDLVLDGVLRPIRLGENRPDVAKQPQAAYL